MGGQCRLDAAVSRRRACAGINGTCMPLRCYSCDRIRPSHSQIEVALGVFRSQSAPVFHVGKGWQTAAHWLCRNCAKQRSFWRCLNHFCSLRFGHPTAQAVAITMLLQGIEPWTSPLPRECSTAELQQRMSPKARRCLGCGGAGRKPYSVPLPARGLQSASVRPIWRAWTQ